MWEGGSDDHLAQWFIWVRRDFHRKLIRDYSYFTSSPTEVRQGSLAMGMSFKGPPQSQRKPLPPIFRGHTWRSCCTSATSIHVKCLGPAYAYSLVVVQSLWDTMDPGHVLRWSSCGVLNHYSSLIPSPNSSTRLWVSISYWMNPLWRQLW